MQRFGAMRAGWCGGTLQGLTSKIGYLKRLGITAMWVSPIFKQVSFQDIFKETCKSIPDPPRTARHPPRPPAPARDIGQRRRLRPAPMVSGEMRSVVPWSLSSNRTEILAINTDIAEARTVSTILDHDVHDPGKTCDVSILLNPRRRRVDHSHREAGWQARR
jgi:hypothetical protein